MKKLLRLGSLCLFLVLGVAAAQAQNILKAIPDNFYFSSRNQVLNILANDLPGDCGSSLNSISIGIVTPPLHGTITISPANVVQYRANSGFYGQDKFTYKITCGANISQADVYLNVSDKPDFIDDAQCIVDAKPALFDIKKMAVSKDYIQSYAIPYVADLDGDGSPEIVALNYHTNYTTGASHYLRYSNAIKIFKYNTNPITGVKTVDLLETIMTSTMASYVVQPLAIADVDGDGIAEIIVGMGNGKLFPSDPAPAHNSFKLRAYKMGTGGAILWESTVPYFSTAPVHDMSAAIAIHDIDGDGLVEIFAGDRVFAGESGKLLATLPSGGGLGRRPFASSLTTDGFIPAVGDIDGDGIMEIVGGNTTYKVVINDRENPGLNSATILARVPQVDGYTSLADIDGDGILDVVVVGVANGNTNTTTGMPVSGPPPQMYVWQGGTSDMIGAPINTNSASGSRPFIGDIDGDGKPDIAFTTFCKIFAYKYTGTAFVPLFPSVVTTDTSGATTMSMFDFDNDGEVELIYRDETDIRIIGVTRNGAGQVTGTYDKAKYTCHSGTHTEYPVIADLDGDGHAEIVVAGSINKVAGNPGYLVNSTQQVMVFASATDSWFPARPVWNQHGYNPTTINEDLSVPANPLYPTSEIIRHDGTVHRPFNSYLQQAGSLNTEGDPLHKVHDLAFQTGKTQRMYYDMGTDKLTITCYISNVGSRSFDNGSIKLSLYSYDTQNSNYDLVGTTTHIAQTIGIGGNSILTLEIPGYSTIIPTLPAQNTWYLAINLNDKGTNAPADYYLDQEECNAWNNLTNSLSYVSANRIMCEDETSLITLDPSGVYTCRWYTAAGAPFPNLANQTGDSQTITKVGDQDEYYLVRVFQGVKEMTLAPDTVHIYASADSLVWTGKESANWHDVRNWFNPSDPTGEAIYRNIPRPCTNVLIPTRAQDGSRIVHYPNLRPAVTDYTLYKDSAACNNISFEHGGEVEFSGLLSYKKAYVQLTLMSNRWYCFAPPLRDFNTGDIFLTNKNPYLDDSFTYVHLFSQTDPEWYSYIEGDWGKTFNSPYYKAPIGQGYGVWIDDLDPVVTNHKEMNYFFPKTEDEYWIYNPQGNPSAGPYPTNKKFAHRLIYEETFNGATNDVLLQVISSSIGKDIIVGNPFMAHLDFDLFYAANSHLIENHYRLMDVDGNYATYRMGGVSTGNPILTKDIAPMQAILVTPRANINTAVVASTLKANMNMTFTNTDPDAKIRMAREAAAAPATDFMWASLATKQGSNRSALVHDPSTTATSMYNADTDMYKFLRKGLAGSNIYFLTEEGLYMDIKTVASLDNLTLRIGINSKKTGPMALAFERLWAFADGYDVYLEDKYEKKTMNMRDDAIYSFTKTTTAELMDDRFVLRIMKIGTSIDEIVNTVSRLHYTSDNGVLTIRTTEGLLNTVQVYDLQGRLLANRQRLESSETSFSLDKGIYIVKVASEGQHQSMKVIVQ